MTLLGVPFAIRLVMMAPSVMAVSMQVRSWGEHRTARFEEQAEIHRALAWESQDWPIRGCLIRPTPRSSYHEEMRLKYRRAAVFPWWPVTDDGPPPAWPEGIAKPRLPLPPLGLPVYRLREGTGRPTRTIPVRPAPVQDEGHSRMKAPRFTVRRLMIVVAIASVVLGMERRSTRFRELSVHHQRKALLAGKPPSKPPAILHHVALSDKYRRAALYPWLAVAPDPPEPK